MKVLCISKWAKAPSPGERDEILPKGTCSRAERRAYTSGRGSLSMWVYSTCHIYRRIGSFVYRMSDFSRPSRPASRFNSSVTLSRKTAKSGGV